MVPTRILLAIDDSDQSARALRLVRDLTRAAPASVVVLQCSREGDLLLR
jgi:nucleotide-binding universal stress UspA family protein